MALGVTVYWLTLARSQSLYKLPNTVLTKPVEVAPKIDSNSSTSDTVNWSSANFQYLKEDERFHLYGKAYLKYQGATLTADTIFLDNKEQVVLAHGVPLIKDKEQPEIIGYGLRYNHKKQIGEIYYGTTKQDKQMFNGTEVRRQATGEILISRGDFSSCDDPEEQHFYFYSRRMVLEPKKMVLARPVVMNISGVPVAVAPMVVVPLGTGRRSGFTRPKIGGDQALGFYMRDLGYYWATNEYMDLKVVGDIIEGSEGTFEKTNLASEFRYHKKNTLSGNVSGTAYLQEFNPNNSGWEVNFGHDQKLTPDGTQTLTGNGRFVSSSRVLSEALDESEAINQTAEAKLGYSKDFAWNRARLRINGSQNYNLTTGKQIRDFPSATFAFSAPLVKLSESDYWDAPGMATDETRWFEKWNYSISTDFSGYSTVAGKNTSGQLEPAQASDSLFLVGTKTTGTLSGQYSLLAHINLTPSINYSNYWSLYSATGDSGRPEADFSPEQGRVGDQLHKFNTALSANTKFFGIANPNIGRFEKIRHTVSPTVSYTFVPPIDEKESFYPHPRFAVDKRQKYAQNLGIGLDNDVDIKLKPSSAQNKNTSSTTTQEKSTSLKIFRLTSNVSYNFVEEKRPFSSIPVNFSSEVVKNIPLNFRSTFQLYDDYSSEPNKLTTPILMNYATQWRKDFRVAGNLSSGVWSTNTPALTSENWSGNLSYGFDYNANRVSATTFEKKLTHSFNANLAFKPTPQWNVGYNTRFDFASGDFAQHAFDISRTLHCWKLDFNWTPVGLSRGWSMKLYIIDIPDIKLESSQTNIRRVNR